MLSLKYDPLTTATDSAECPTGCSRLRNRAVRNALSPPGEDGLQTQRKEGLTLKPGSPTIRGYLGFATKSGPSDSHPPQTTIGYTRCDTGSWTRTVAGSLAEGPFPMLLCPSYSCASTSKVFPAHTYCLHSATERTRTPRPGRNKNLTCIFLRAVSMPILLTLSQPYTSKQPHF